MFPFRSILPLLLLVCIAACGQLGGAEAKPKPTPGVITALDTTKLTLAIATTPKGGAAPASVEASVPAGTFITIDKQPSSLSDLKVGDKVAFVAKDGVITALMVTRNPAKPKKK